MKRRYSLKSVGTGTLAAGVTPPWGPRHAASLQDPYSGTSDTRKEPEQASPETILLMDYRPKSLYKIPTRSSQAEISNRRHAHSHAYAKTPAEIAVWVRNMGEVGIEKIFVLTEATGQEFNDIRRKYAVYRDRFELCCGFDYGGYDQLGFGAHAIRELEKCHQPGAQGVGELHDKGKGLVS